MSFRGSGLFACTALWLFSGAPALAQAPDDGAANGGGEIIVSARRRAENLQDVPLTVNVVSSDLLAKTNIREFQDIAVIVPGLTLTPSLGGVGTSATIRGVNYDTLASGNNGTIEFYQNDAPVPGIIAMQSLFDIDQIEVLRGPQGTLRGRATPSGSITIGTRRPDLQEIGGTVSLTGTTYGGVNTNGAVNLPLVHDVVAIRLAGLISSEDRTRVRSIHNLADANYRTRAFRASLRAEPFNGDVKIDLTYQKLIHSQVDNDPVQSFNLINSGSAASPVTIRAEDRRAVNNLSRRTRQNFDIVNGRVQWQFEGQQLTYVGSWNRQKVTAFNPFDYADIFTNEYDPAGNFFGQAPYSVNHGSSHEIRLQNVQPVAGLFDYVIGYFRKQEDGYTSIFRPTATAVLTPAPTLTSVTYNFFESLSTTKESSFFGNLTLHIGDRTEISGGARRIHYETLGSSRNNGIPNPAFAGIGPQNATIYSASVKHRFSPNLLVYASTGSSWRPPITVTGPINVSALELSFLKLPAEKSRSYEVGIKSQWFDNRLVFNLTGYHQTFDNYPYRPSSAIYYINRDTSTTGNWASFTFVSPVPVTVNGVEAEFAFRPDRHWSFNGSVSYAHSKFSNAQIACLDLNGDGVPDTVTGAPPQSAITGPDYLPNNVSACRSNYPAGFGSPWNASLQAEYAADVGHDLDGFVRGLVTWKNNSITDPVNPYDDVRGYGILNLYAGVRDPGGQWDFTLYAKNITNSFRVLTATNGPQATALSSPGAQSYTNYVGISTTAPREFGATLRYAFGSK